MFWPSALVNQEFRKFVLYDQLLVVLMDSEAVEMRAKTEDVKSVYIILTQWPATRIEDSCTSTEGDVYITLHPSAHEEQQHRYCASGKGGNGAAWCFSARNSFGLSPGFQSPSSFFPWLGRTNVLTEITRSHQWIQTLHVGYHSATCTDWLRGRLGSSEWLSLPPLKPSWGCTVNYSTSKMLQNSVLVT